MASDQNPCSPGLSGHSVTGLPITLLSREHRAFEGARSLRESMKSVLLKVPQWTRVQGASQRRHIVPERDQVQRPGCWDRKTLMCQLLQTKTNCFLRYNLWESRAQSPTGPSLWPSPLSTVKCPHPLRAHALMFHALFITWQSFILLVYDVKIYVLLLGHNFCAEGPKCGENSECKNWNTKATCECKNGYISVQGDPAYCEGKGAM